MTAIPQFPISGYATILGSHLNKLVTLLNNITGNGTAAPVSASTLSATGLATLTGGVKSAGPSIEAITIVAAAGASQGNATAISTAVSVVSVTVTASTEGVKLPVAATGKFLLVLANTLIGAKVYPATGNIIANGATNGAFTLAKDTSTQFMAVDAVHWRVLKGA